MNLGSQLFFNGDSGTNLSINVLFKTEENVRFESHLLGEEAITINSPMNILVIIANVMEIVLILLLMLWRSLTQNFEVDYTIRTNIPTDSESPQDIQ